MTAASSRTPESPRWAKFKALAPEARYVPEGASLLKNSDVDAVVACLSWKATQDWLELLLQAPKPVLIEKPLALSSAPLKAALAAAGPRAADKRVGYNRRFYEPVEELRRRLASGGLKSAEITICEDVASHIAKHGPDIVAHLPLFSSHVLDLALHLLGPLEIQRAYPHAAAKGAAAPRLSVTALLETRSGAPVWLSLNADDPTPVGLRLRFNDGSAWHLAPLETLRVYRGTQVLAADEKTNIRRYLPRLEAEHHADGRFKPGLLAQMRAFLAGEPGPTPEESLRLIEFVERLYGGGHGD